MLKLAGFFPSDKPDKRSTIQLRPHLLLQLLLLLLLQLLLLLLLLLLRARVMPVLPHVFVHAPVSIMGPVVATAIINPGPVAATATIIPGGVPATAAIILGAIWI